MVVLTEGLVAGTEQSKAKPLEGLNLLGPSALLPLYPCFPAQPSQFSGLGTFPAWLQNAIDCDSGEPECEQALRDRYYFAGPAHAWVDSNLIAGNADNEAIAKRALAYFTRLMDFSLLVSVCAVKRITVRLKGLVKT